MSSIKSDRYNCYIISCGSTGFLVVGVSDGSGHVVIVGLKCW